MKPRKETYYARCVECGYRYATRAAVTGSTACPACANPTRVLNPADDVYLSGGYRPRLRELCHLAHGFAAKLAFSHPTMKRAPRIVAAVRGRLNATQGHPQVNWHEVQLLGWWASQALETKVTWTVDKLVGTAKRVTLFLWELEQAFPQKAAVAPLSQVTHLSRDQVEKFFQEGPGARAMEEGRALSQDDIQQFPARPEGDKRPHALEPAMKAYKSPAIQVPAAPPVGVPTPQVIVDAFGKALRNVPPEPTPSHPSPLDQGGPVAKVVFFKPMVEKGRRSRPGEWFTDPSVPDPILCCPICGVHFAPGENPVGPDGTLDHPVLCPGPPDPVAVQPKPSFSCTFNAPVRLLGWEAPAQGHVNQEADHGND